MDRPQLRIEATEKDIEDCIAYDCNGFLGLDFIARQINTPAGIIDVLAKSREQENVYFVIEIKKDCLNAKSLCQVLRYTAYMNNQKSKDGKRLFIPLLIGQNLTDELIKCVHFYDGCVDPMNIYYRIFSACPYKGLSFLYYNNIQREYEREYLSEGTYFDQINEKIEQIEYEKHQLIEEFSA